MEITSFLAFCPYIDDYFEHSILRSDFPEDQENVFDISRKYILSWAEQSVGRAFLIHGKIPEYNGKCIIGLLILITVSEEIEKFYYFLSSPGDWEAQTEVVEVSKEDVDPKLFIIFG